MMRVLTNRANTKASQLVRVLLAIVLVMTMSPTVPAYAQSESTTTPMKLDGTLFTSADIYSQEVALPEVLDELEREAIAQASVQQQTVQIAQPQSASANVYRATVPIAQPQTDEDAISQGDPEPVSEPLEDKGAYPLSGEGAESTSGAGESADASAGATSGTTLGITLEAADEYAISYDLNVPEGEEAKPAPASYAPKTVRFGEDTPLPDGDEPTLEGYIFLGWTDMPNGGKTYGSAQADWDTWGKSEKWDKLEGATLYAQWENIDSNELQKSSYSYDLSFVRTNLSGGSYPGSVTLRLETTNWRVHVNNIDFTIDELSGYRKPTCTVADKMLVGWKFSLRIAEPDIGARLLTKEIMAYDADGNNLTPTWVLCGGYADAYFEFKDRSLIPVFADCSLVQFDYADFRINGTKPVYCDSRIKGIAGTHPDTIMTTGEPSVTPENYAAPGITGADGLDALVFDGWIDSSGKKYLNADGTSAKDWDKKGNTTLYPNWIGSGITYYFSGDMREPTSLGDNSYWNEYRDTFHGNYGVTNVYPKDREGSDATRFNDFHLTGYELLGWFSQPIGGTQIIGTDGKISNGYVLAPDPSNPVTIYAQWKAKIYTVKYDAQGGLNASGAPATFAEKTATYAAAAPTPDYYVTPKRSGFTLLGWYANKIADNADDTTSKRYLNADGTPAAGQLWDIDEDATLYAVWSGNQITITFDAQGGGEFQDSSAGSFTQQYSQGTTFAQAQIPAINPNTGYFFDGWYTHEVGGTKVTTSMLIPTHNTTYYAHYITTDNPDAEGAKNTDVTSKLFMQSTVSFDANFPTLGGTTTINSKATGGSYASVIATYGKAVPKPSDYASAPTKAGWTFKGWYGSKSGGTQYLGADGTATDAAGATLSAFDVIDSTTKLTPDTFTLYAQWEPADITLTWDLNGGNVDGSIAALATQTAFATGVSATSPNKVAMPASAPTKQGAHFVGWYTDKNKSDATRITSASDCPSMNTTYYAQWAYEVTLDGNGATSTPTPDKIYYWANHGYTLSVPAYSASSTTEPTLIKTDSTAASIVTIERTGYTLTSFTRKDTSTVCLTSPAYDITAKLWSAKLASTAPTGVEAAQTWVANWTRNAVPKVTLNANGGTQAADTTKEIYQWTGKGWYDTADPQDTSNALSVIVAPTRTGYTFMGYAETATDTSAAYFTKNTDGTLEADLTSFPDNRAFTGDKPLYAVWQANTYQPTTFSDHLEEYFGTADNDYIGTKGSVSGYTAGTYPATEMTYDADTKTPAGYAAPQKTGWTLLGWYDEQGDDKTVYDDTYNAAHKYLNADGTSNKTWDKDGATMLHAVWVAKTATVKYDDAFPQDATGSAHPANNADATLIYDSAVPAPKTMPTRDGYTLLGWYDEAQTASTNHTDEYNTSHRYISSDGTDAKIWDKDTTETQTFYAHWQVNTYTVTIDKNFPDNNGGTTDGNVPESVNITYGQASTITHTTAPSAIGFGLQGYFDQASGGTKYADATGASVKAWDKHVLATDEAGQEIPLTLYAQWTPKIYTVKYDAQGSLDATGAPATFADKTATYAAAAPTPDNYVAPYRAGFTLVGWYANKIADNADDTTSKRYLNADGTPAAGQLWDIDEDATLYAVWSGNQITLTFDAQGGDFGTTSSDTYTKRFVPGAPIGQDNIPSITREGYTFVGWYTAHLGAGELVDAETLLPSTDTTYHAHWTSNNPENPDDPKYDPDDPAYDPGAAAGLAQSRVTSKMFMQTTIALNDNVPEGEVATNTSGLEGDYTIAWGASITEALGGAGRTYTASAIDGWILSGWGAYESEDGELVKYFEADGTPVQGALWKATLGEDGLAPETSELYAIWQGDDVAITLVPTGGTFADNDWNTLESGAIQQTRPYMTGEALGAPKVYRTGYDFAGWFTDALGGVEVTQLPKHDAIYYAHWTTIDPDDPKYDSDDPKYDPDDPNNDPTDPGVASGIKQTDVTAKAYMRSKVVLADSFPKAEGTETPSGLDAFEHTYAVVPDALADHGYSAPSKEGFALEGWYDSAEGGHMIFDAQGAPIAGADGTVAAWSPALDAQTGLAPDEVTLYARWSVEVVLHATNATGDMKGDQLIRADIGGSLHTSLPDGSAIQIPERANYTFAGWGLEGARGQDAYLSWDGEVLSATDKVYELANGRDFYPIWIGDAFAITFDQGTRPDGTAWAEDDDITLPANLTVDIDEALDEFSAAATDVSGSPRYRVIYWYLKDAANDQEDPGSADGQGVYSFLDENADGINDLTFKEVLQAAGYAVDGSPGIPLPEKNEARYRPITIVAHWEVLALRVGVPTAVAFWAQSTGSTRQVLTPDAGTKAGQYRIVNYGDEARITQVSGVINSDAFTQVFPGKTDGLSVSVGVPDATSYSVLSGSTGTANDTASDTSLTLPQAPSATESSALPLKLSMTLPADVPLAYLPTDADEALGATNTNTKFMRIVYTIKLARDVAGN